MLSKRLYLLIVTLCVNLIFCLSACLMKQGPISNLSDLTEEVQVNGSNYSEEEWNLVNEELEAIESEMEQYQDEYTDEELREIGRMKGILYAQYTKYSAKSFMKGLENAVKEAEGFVDGFMNGLSSEPSE